MHKIAMASSAFCAGAFLATVFLFKTDPDDFLALDTLSSRVVAPFQSFTPSEFFIAITTLGSVFGVVLITLLVVFLMRSQRTLIARLIFASLASGLSVYAGKELIARVRPDGLPWLTQLHSYSFPSGHTAAATTLYGFIGIIVYFRMKRSLMRTVLLVLLASLVLAIGISRIVLSAHYGSDVLAGFFLGGLSLSLFFNYPLTRKERLYLKRK